MLQLQSSHFGLISKMLSYNIFHNDSINGDIPPGQHIFIYKFLSHKLIKDILLFSINFRQEWSIYIDFVL